MRDEGRPLWSLTASELDFASGAHDPVAVTEACLARLDAINPRLNAVVAVDAKGARATAAASAARWRAGKAIGPLDGVPLTVKDNLYAGGLGATWGSLLFADHIAPMDDIPVARLRPAGAVILGKTNSPELALAGYTDNRVFGATGNPWAPELSSGGSSGGAASAVMAGIGALALVTDAGGSTRRPASYVGCLGLKPAPGRIPRRYGFPPLAGDFQAIGLLARSVRDTRRFFGAVADPWSAPGLPDGALRIGAVCRIGAHPVEPDIEQRWRETMRLLAVLGHHVEEIAAPYDPEEAGALLLGLGAVGVARVVRKVAGWEDKVTPAIAALARQGLATSGADYVDLTDRVARFRAEVGDVFSRVDLLLTPSVAGGLWPKAEPAVKTIAGQPAGPRAAAIYSTFANVAALAGLSIPAGLSAAGHPIGMQLVGPAGSEERLLDLAEAIERAQPWPTLAPL